MLYGYAGVPPLCVLLSLVTRDKSLGRAAHGPISQGRAITGLGEL